MLKVTRVSGALPSTRWRDGKLYKLLSWDEDEETIKNIGKRIREPKMYLLSDGGMYGLYVGTTR